MKILGSHKETSQSLRAVAEILGSQSDSLTGPSMIRRVGKAIVCIPADPTEQDFADAEFAIESLRALHELQSEGWGNGGS